MSKRLLKNIIIANKNNKNNKTKVKIKILNGILKDKEFIADKMQQKNNNEIINFYYIINNNIETYFNEKDVLEIK
jgi:hypothetical protein